MKGDQSHSLYFGRVMHARVAPFTHRFEYRVFSALLDLDRLNELPKKSRLFSLNRFGLFGFKESDHGPKDGSALRPWVEDELKRSGISERPKIIKLLCYPRILGYVFNPLSVYYCYDDEDCLYALLYEVSNTFGEQHVYVARANGMATPDKVAPHTKEKVFYVSPFIEVKGDYLFRVRDPKEKISLQIELSENGNPLLFTAFLGKHHPINTRTLLKAFFKYPLMTIKVIGAIHWQALLLWFKGAIYVPNPSKVNKPNNASQYNGIKSDSKTVARVR